MCCSVRCSVWQCIAGVKSMSIYVFLASAYRFWESAHRFYIYLSGICMYTENIPMRKQQQVMAILAKFVFQKIDHGCAAVGR